MVVSIAAIAVISIVCSLKFNPIIIKDENPYLGKSMAESVVSFSFRLWVAAWEIIWLPLAAVVILGRWKLIGEEELVAIVVLSEPMVKMRRWAGTRKIFKYRGKRTTKKFSCRHFSKNYSLGMELVFALFAFALLLVALLLLLELLWMFMLGNIGFALFPWGGFELGWFWPPKKVGISLEWGSGLLMFGFLMFGVTWGPKFLFMIWFWRENKILGSLLGICCPILALKEFLMKVLLFGTKLLVLHTLIWEF